MEETNEREREYFKRVVNNINYADEDKLRMVWIEKLIGILKTNKEFRKLKAFRRWK